MYLTQKNKEKEFAGQEMKFLVCQE